MIHVIGTGPAGLTAAYLLAKRGQQVTLVEPGTTVGGLWAGFTEKDGSHFERGMHTYVECGIREIDDFFMRRVQAHDLSGKDRDRGGVYWDGHLNSRSPYIDLTHKVTEISELARDALLAAVLDTAHADRALDRATSQFGSVIAARFIRPILIKLFGTIMLSGRALDLTNLTRVCVLDERYLKPLMVLDHFRKRFGWPNHETLPEQYLPTRRAIYPVGGMVELVNATITDLQTMGVQLVTHAAGPDLKAIVENPQNRIVWSAPLKGFCSVTDRHFPKLAARSLTVVNIKGKVHAGGVHYFFCYEPKFATYRVTCYDNFSFNQFTTVELLDTPAEHAAARAREELAVMTGTKIPPEAVAGVHELGPVLVVPSPDNDSHFMASQPRLKHVTFVGQAARPGLFFQPDVLRNVHTTIHSMQFLEGNHDRQLSETP